MYQAMGEHDTALKYHMLDLEIGQRSGDKPAQIRACGNIGATYEAMKDWDKAGSYHDQLLNIATLVNDREAKIKAFSNLGKENNLFIHLGVINQLNMVFTANAYSFINTLLHAYKVNICFKIFLKTF